MKKTALSAMAAVLAACGGSERAVSNDPFCQAVLPMVDAYLERVRSENPTPDDDRYGGTIVVGGYGEISDGMNAAVSGDNTATQHQNFVNLMTLIDYDERFEPRPYLAESWEMSPDSLEITFHIRRDVFWHDGQQTDAHDVAFTWDVVTDPLTAFPNAAFWDHWVHGPEGVEVVDDFTVRLHLTRIHADFLDPWRQTAILPEHLLGDVPRDSLRQHPFGTQCPVGNGPFVFNEHRTNERWVFDANPAFPASLGGRPFVDRYIYRIVPDQTTLLTELLTENVDVYISVIPDHAQSVLDDPALELKRFMQRQYIFVGWNSRRPQLADARVRRALTMGTDRESIVRSVVRGYGTVAHTGVPPFHWAFDPNAVEPLPYDPEAARALLDEAGWRDRDGDGVRESADGTRLSFVIKYNTNQTRQQVAEIMQSQLAQIGVEAQPQVVEYTTLMSQIQTPSLRDFDAIVLGWSADFKLDDTDLFHSERIDRPYAFSGTRNPEMDRLLEAISNTADREQAKELWTEYQAVLVAEQPYTFVYFPDRLDGVNRRVRNVVMDTRGDWVNVKDWYLDPASR